jgi:hypothetical protein
MKRRNIVILNGVLALDKMGTREVDGQPIPAVWCHVETDRKALGGLHTVVAYGRRALEVRAFVEAAKARDRRADCTVDGWLRSGEEKAAVVAEDVTFHVGAEVAAEARRLLRGYLEGGTQGARKGGR